MKCTPGHREDVSGGPSADLPGCSPKDCFREQEHQELSCGIGFAGQACPLHQNCFKHSKGFSLYMGGSKCALGLLALQPRTVRDVRRSD